MADQAAAKKIKETDAETNDPVQVIRQGAIAALIWLQQSPPRDTPTMTLHSIESLPSCKLVESALVVKASFSMELSAN